MSTKKAARFQKRRDDIIQTASNLLNRHGAQGFRRADIAAILKLDTSTLSYYFKKKDDLIAACLSETIEWLDDAASASAPLPTQEARTAAFIDKNIALFVHQRNPANHKLALLSDLATLGDETRIPLMTKLGTAYRKVADFRPAGGSATAEIERAVASNMLLSIAYWIPAWQMKYRIRDLETAGNRVKALFANGTLASKAFTPPTQTPSLEPEMGDEARANFLKAATRQINQYGYQGARVERIAGDLGLSTGSFYHHLRTKDELVTASFERSFTILENAIDAAADEKSPSLRLTKITWLLAHHQLFAEVPLLRISSYQALPEDLREETLRRTDQFAHYFSGLIADGIAEGSLAACDPVITANCLMAALHGLSDISRKIRRDHPEETLSVFMRMISQGIYAAG